MPFLRIFHRFLEFVWNPGIILFDNEFGHCGPFRWRQRLDLFNDFLRAHAFYNNTQNDWPSNSCATLSSSRYSKRIVRRIDNKKNSAAIELFIVAGICTWNQPPLRRSREVAWKI